MTIRPGDVVLVQLPVTVGPAKPRPAIILAELSGPHQDYLVCGISSQLRQFVSGWDEKIEPASPDFASTGLRLSSIIRLSHLHNASRSNIIGQIGTITSERLERMLARLADHLRPPIGNTNP